MFFLGATAVFGQDAEPAGTEGVYEDATTLKLKIFKLAIAANADCSTPVTVFESASGVEADLIAKQNFGSGKIPNGTYNCVIIEMSKNITTTAAVSACTTPKASSLCVDSWASKLINGSDITCSGGNTNDQRVALYFTTLATENSGNRIFLPPLSGSDTTSGAKLDAAIVFPSKKKGVLKVKKHIVDTVTCSAAGATFGFGVP